MLDEGAPRIVALDGGTTNTRARLIENERVVATARQPVGVRNNVLEEGNPLVRAVQECLSEVLRFASGPVSRVVAAGMLSSEVGLTAVPHVLAPAGAAELARQAKEIAIPEIHSAPILVVPGIKTSASDGPSGWTSADVMRGEEVETFGAIEALGLQHRPAVFLWPGSHTKLIEVDEASRITRSFTTLAGEMTVALAQHTLIAKSLPHQLPDDPDPDALEQGIQAARRDGIGRAAFLVRIADLTGALTPPQRAAFWIGAVLAEDASRLASHAILQKTSVPVFIGGRDPQRSIYARCLRELLGRERHVQTLDDQTATIASALGACHIAGLRG